MPHSNPMMQLTTEFWFPEENVSRRRHRRGTGPRVKRERRRRGGGLGPGHALDPNAAIAGYLAAASGSPYFFSRKRSRAAS